MRSTRKAFWSSIWEGVKGLFGGKGTTQIGAHNRSVSGINVGDNAGVVSIVVGDGNHGVAAQPPKVPVIRVSPALTNHPFRGIVHFLSITILNTTDRTLFLGNFMMGMEGNNIFVRDDKLTGELQHKRQLSAGDKLSFHIDVTTLKEIGRPASDYISVFVEDVVGPEYRFDDTQTLQACIQELLEEEQ